MTIVLHHTLASPFAELARLALGFKNLAYHSVVIPNVLPKPDLVELTGGYARTPVLQIGADIYCDTAAVMDALEARQPEPTFEPQPLQALHRVIASWAGTAPFIAHIGAAFGSIAEGAIPQAFLDDRKARFGLDIPQFASSLPHNEAQVVALAAWLNDTLSDGRRFLGGEAAGRGDLAAYVNLWFVRGRAPHSFASSVLATMAPLDGWMRRVAAIGHGRPVTADATEAISIAAAAIADGTIRIDKRYGVQAGSRVRIRSADASRDDPVEGELLRLDASSIAIARRSGRAGKVVVNFPRHGQMVERSTTDAISPESVREHRAGSRYAD